MLGLLCSDPMLESCNEVYYGGYEEFVWGIVMGEWLLYLVVYEVYIVEAICEYVNVMKGILCLC